MAILKREGADQVYAVARLFREQALECDGSLLTPGHAVWTLSCLDELRERFVLQPDESGDAFLIKLERQLADASDGAIQLMAEVLIVYLLITSAVGGKRKREQLAIVLGWMRDSVTVPDDIDAVLDHGLAHPGTVFNTKKYRQVEYLIEFMRSWKAKTPHEREGALGDPWLFKEQLQGISVEATAPQRNALLHLLHPETFERMISQSDKTAAIVAFADLIGGLERATSLDPDRALLQIRHVLRSQHGADFDFYATPAVRSQWKSGGEPPPDNRPAPAPLLDLVHRVYPAWSGFADQEFIENELDYKRVASQKAQSLLGETPLRQLIDTRQFDEVINRLRALAQATNLLWMRVPQQSDIAILSRQDLDYPAFAGALLDLLHGPGSSPERIEGYARWASERGLPCTWALPTYLLMLVHPDTDYFVKPRATKWFLREMGEEPHMGAHPTAAVYERILATAQSLFESLSQYGPADLMDVQGYVWTAYRAPEDEEGLEVETETPREGMTVSENGSVYDFVQQRGFHFPDWLVTDYVLSAAAKPLVILSGISGTGKTKMAQLVSEFVAPAQEREVLVEGGRAPSREGAVRIPIRPSAFQHRRLTIPSVLLGGVVVPDPNTIRDLSVRAGGQSWDARLYAHASARNFQVHMKPGLYEWFKGNAAMGDLLEMSVVTVGGDSEFELEIAVVRSERRIERVPSERIAFLSVRPDWTDNRALLGYYNPLLQRYQGTEMLRLLLRAEANPDEAHFVILDEMNLAKVEYYFSDFLSAMESETEMVLHDVDDEVVESETQLPPKRLRVPANIIFTGTVNVDETTYMFSPKVLDRANVIEFNDVDLESYGVGADFAADAFHLAGGVTLGEILAEARKPTPDDWAALPSAYQNRIRAIHAAMQKHGLHFGYRVANEIARYLNLALAYVGEDQLDFAFDLQVLQKVLPKLSGSRAKLERPLDDLLLYLQEEDLNLSAAKVGRMLDTVRTVGFVSFVE